MLVCWFFMVCWCSDQVLVMECSFCDFFVCVMEMTQELLMEDIVLGFGGG